MTHEHGSDSTAGDWLYLAFFSGGSEPVLQANALENSKTLCGTFNYLKAAQSQPTESPDVPQKPAHMSVEDSKRSATQSEVLAKAKAGDAASQEAVGLAYANGKGVTKDYAQAADWFRKAADQGFEKAQHNLAVCYENGQGVPQDYTKAAMWYRKAAEQGNAESQYKIGVMYALGQGVPRDHAQGAIWSRKAAEQGNVNAQFNIGLLYEKGQGVPHDYAQAALWLRKAVAQGDTEARSALERVQREAEDAKKPRTALTGAATDAAVGNCIDKYIATGRYFLIDLTTGRLDVQKSSLKLVTTCQGPVSAWINLCEKGSGNSYICTQGAMLTTQQLLLDGWNHRSNLKNWAAR